MSRGFGGIAYISCAPAQLSIKGLICGPQHAKPPRSLGASLPRGDLVRQRLNAHIRAGGLVLGEGAGVHGALAKLEGAVRTPLSEAATIAMATGLALAGKSVVVELVDPASLARALDAVADLADIAVRTERTFTPSVVIRVPGGTDLRALSLPVFIAGRESDAAEQLAQALQRGGVCVLVDDSNPEAPEGLPEAPAGEPVVLREGAAITVLAVGGACAAALAAAEGFDAHVVEVRGAGSVAAAIARTGRVVVVGDKPGSLTASLNEAFWSLEAPWVQLPRGSTVDAVRNAIHSVLGA